MNVISVCFVGSWCELLFRVPVHMGAAPGQSSICWVSFASLLWTPWDRIWAVEDTRRCLGPCAPVWGLGTQPPVAGHAWLCGLEPAGPGVDAKCLGCL